MELESVEGRSTNISSLFISLVNRDSVRWERANELLHPQPASPELTKARERVRISHENLDLYMTQYIDKVQEFTGTLEKVVGQAKQMFASFSPPAKVQEEPTQVPQIEG